VLRQIPLFGTSPFSLRTQELLTKHTAVLGMTGAGKSNAVKVLLRNLLRLEEFHDLRVVVIDTHGEYAAVADALAGERGWTDLAVEVDRSLMEEGEFKEEALKRAFRRDRRDGALFARLQEIADTLGDDDDLPEFCEVLRDAANEEEDDKAAAALLEVVEQLCERDDLCLREENAYTLRERARQDHEAGEVRVESSDVETAGGTASAARMVEGGGAANGTAVGPEVDLSRPGLYILNLREHPGLIARARMAGGLMNRVYRRSLEVDGREPFLVVIDEAQNYAPEQQTGLLKRLRFSEQATFALASEGRKFNVGILVASQRPARVSKNILSQCNTHVIFRVANVEDLDAIGGSFEAASRGLLDELPGFDVGTCAVGGTGIGMVTRVAVPEFRAVAM